MRIIQLPAREISRFGSTGVDMDFLPQVPEAERTTVNVARIVAGGVLGEHPATSLQIFAVLAGEGVVTSRGADGAAERWEIEPGQAAVWEPGEIHATTATTDLLAVIVETTADTLAFREHELLSGPPLD
ncbi:cupin domain-containing protein [Promicromonospora sukumoe]|uniref:cupin domain-containing protein n=1 Tax=Promicromonospora sukumoe TaxID=88382 RepID=UPI0003797C21|nr:cupin domain-containing protein [Promicromonospora sukumoe]